MRQTEIENVKKFTNALFAGNVFDSFCVTEASFSTLIDITIDGHINPDFGRDKEKPEGVSFADAELAWTSFDVATRIFKFAWNVMLQGDMKNKEAKIHPTQKPVRLYEWCLSRYAKDGDTILDTHVGSASSLIACRRTNHKYIGFEIDPVYYKKAKERIDTETAQVNIFDLLQG